MKPALFFPLLIWATVGLQPATAAERIAQRFTGGQLDRQLFTLIGSPPDHQTVAMTSRGLLVQLEGTTGPRQAGLQTLFGLRGDFEITVVFELKDKVAPEAGYGKGFIIRLQSAASPDRNLAFGCRTLRSGETVFNTNLTSQKDGQLVHDEQLFKTSVLSAALRLRRTGGTVHFEVDEGGKKKARELREVDFGTDSIARLQFLADNGGDKQPLTALLISCHVEADELLQGASRRELTTSSSVWVMCSIGGILSVIAAVIIKRKLTRS